MLRYLDIPSLLFIAFCSLMIIFLAFLLWWEDWGQWIFNRIVLKKIEKKIEGDKGGG
jgi:hypothetical protein